MTSSTSKMSCATSAHRYSSSRLSLRHPSRQSSSLKSPPSSTSSNLQHLIPITFLLLLLSIQGKRLLLRQVTRALFSYFLTLWTFLREKENKRNSIPKITQTGCIIVNNSVIGFLETWNAPSGISVHFGELEIEEMEKGKNYLHIRGWLKERKVGPSTFFVGNEWGAYF